MRVHRATVVRTLVPLLASVPFPLLASEDDLSTMIRKAVVRGAQTADRIDGAWQKIAAPLNAQLRPPLSAFAAPPAASLQSQSIAAKLLSLPCEVAVSDFRVSREDLEVKLAQAERAATVLYGDFFSKSFLEGPTSVPSGEANSTYFAFRAFATWRALDELISTAPMRRQFNAKLGEAILVELDSGSIGGGKADGKNDPATIPKVRVTDSEQVIIACAGVLSRLQRSGLISQFVLNDNSLDEDALEAVLAKQTGSGACSWEYLISGSVLAGVSQLALLKGYGADAPEKGGSGAGVEFTPAQGLLVAPLVAACRRIGLDAIEPVEYFVDPRFTPDPKFDIRDYTQSLLTLNVPGL